VSELLRFAEELERRDERASVELAGVETLRREVEEVRAAADAVASFLAGLPAALADAAAEEEAAAAARGAAERTRAAADERLARAEQRGKEDERVAAAREVQHARDALHEAELRVEQAAAARRGLEREGDERWLDAEELERRAHALAERLGRVPRVAHEAGLPPAAGLENVLGWTARARGALLLAAAGIASERERVAREATELVASVSGDPRALSGVAGIRERVARELEPE
jgi:chromosome segregation protein